MNFLTNANELVFFFFFINALYVITGLIHNVELIVEFSS